MNVADEAGDVVDGSDGEAAVILAWVEDLVFAKLVALGDEVVM